jgi:hypothetical protein
MPISEEGAVVISDQMTREIEKTADRFWHRARGLLACMAIPAIPWHTEKSLRNPGLKFQPM